MRLGLVDHDQTALFAGYDFVDHLVTAAATDGCSAMISDLSHAAGAGVPDGTTDVSIGEGVTMTDEHRGSV